MLGTASFLHTSTLLLVTQPDFVFNYRLLSLVPVKEGRFKIAAELCRLRSERKLR